MIDNYSIADVSDLRDFIDMPINRIKGVVGSLVKRGIIDPDEGNYFWLTDEGLEWLDRR